MFLSLTNLLLEDLFWILCQIFHGSLFRVSYWNFISFLWWYYVYLIFDDTSFLTLISVHLIKQSLHQDITGSLWQTLLHQSVHLRIMDNSAGNILGKCGLLLSLFWQDCFLRSAGWEQLNRTTGLVPRSNMVVRWAP